MYEFKILRKISKVSFKISHNILNPFTAKYVFYEVLKVWQIVISLAYDILSFSETDPWGELQPANVCKWFVTFQVTPHVEHMRGDLKSHKPFARFVSSNPAQLSIVC